jgi:hydroxymethylpyrimidine/phosphomethylpyrimidine kinase
MPRRTCRAKTRPGGTRASLPGEAYDSDPVALPQIDSPQVVVVGGVDPGGGAGLLRDMATARSLGARAHAIGTAWTEQGPEVHRVEPRAPAAVRDALAAAVRSLRPSAVKIGMAVGPATAVGLVDGLADFAGPVVVDPVLATSRGGSLWAGSPPDLLPLLRRATLVTPNAPEAAALAGQAVTTVDDAVAAGRFLVGQQGLRTVLIKGGHLDLAAGQVTDTLVEAGRVSFIRHARASGPGPRGTGCALATAIAVGLGRGRPVSQAVEEAIAWLATAIRSAMARGDEKHLPDAGP